MIPFKLFKTHRLPAWIMVSLFFLMGMIQSACAHDSASHSHFDQIREKGVLRIGISPFTPWVFKNNDGKWVGFEIDVAKKLSKDMGVTPKLISYDWEELIPALNDGKIDIIIAGMAITPQRALKVNFSAPYATSGISLATNIERTKDIKSVDELNRESIKIGVISATVSEGLAKRIFSNASIVAFKKSNDAEDAIVSGKIHAYIEAKPIPHFIALDHPEKVDVPLSNPLLATKAGMAVNKGDQDFLNYLNSWIITRQTDTWLTSLHKYWFETLLWK